ncbi:MULTISPECIES: histone deacetylase [unclassified Pseudoalteromonas]|uniref:histone deacetylase family protein n=1 Tax=Pseudoalteromonas TaxID=53246 RepID=UPI00101F7A24|nr:MULTISPECIES: histone deacetylase [unclassified Pseudoalteromonas]MCP4584507.1 histone deacetylase [Pseudoalteromonas sp.]QLE08657.1 histone deacetylase [Pseudoalteromonas shioyasakiensis]QWV05252.1 histone deacetylase [Pseudoalteromonas shioyasakiensis]RZD23567.1 histone deacetylase [Pseudoalteromonas sp. MEBiC 03485]
MQLNPHLPLVYHPNYSFSFDPNHRFVMSKFAYLYEHVQSLGLINDNLTQPVLGTPEPLELVHCENYINDLWHNRLDEKAMRRIGLPWSKELMARTFTAPLGTLQAARLALKHGIACHLAGGTHHAHTDFGSGYCMVNDLAFTSETLIKSGEVTNILIFDLDVHQGDGTAAMLEHQPYAYTCSIHCEKNFPFRKSASDLDIGLAPNVADSEYLGVVDDTLSYLLNTLNPDLVLYDAGVDVWQQDGLGKLDISWQGIEQRDHLVFKRCLERNVPVATVIGGGYDKDHRRLAARHGIVVEQAARF